MKGTATVVLASTSRYRRALMDQLRLDYVAVAPEYEEENDLELPPEQLVRLLARKKAESLAARFPDSLIIGADQVAELDGQLLFKPGTAERAVAQLLTLAGRTHRLVTGVAVHSPSQDRTEVVVDVHRMVMRPLTPKQAAFYVAHDDPVDCAGAYKVESLGVALFEAMEGRDHTGIVGLPLTRVVQLLGRFGVDVLQRDEPPESGDPSPNQGS